jgi:hypothetical protein
VSGVVKRLGHAVRRYHERKLWEGDGYRFLSLDVVVPNRVPFERN